MVDFTNGVKRTEAIHPNRGILLPAQWMPIAASEFTGQLGYSEPADLMLDRAVSEVVIYRRDGYRNLMGIVGGHPLHHTRLDTPANVTSPAAS